MRSRGGEREQDVVGLSLVQQSTVTHARTGIERVSSQQTRDACANRNRLRLQYRRRRVSMEGEGTDGPARVPAAKSSAGLIAGAVLASAAAGSRAVMSGGPSGEEESETVE